MKKHRIVLIKATTALGDPVKWYAVQVRVAFFWWVTIGRMSQLSQARYYLESSGATERTEKEKVLKVVK